MIDKTPPPAPAGKANTATSYAPRVIGFTTVNEMYCGAGHHLRQDTILLEDAILRCQYRAPLANGRGGGPECGRRLYVCLGWQPRGAAVEQLAADPFTWPASTPVFIAEVSERESLELKKLRLDVWGVLRYLGVRFPLTALTPAH